MLSIGEKTMDVIHRFIHAATVAGFFVWFLPSSAWTEDDADASFV